MSLKSMDLVWIVVKDLQQAIQFYTALGLKLLVQADEFGWAELQGPQGGARLGICQEDAQGKLKAGKNGYITLTVENLDQSLADLKKKGIKCVGDIEEVPGHVKLQMVVDADGNHFQLVEKLGE